MTDPAWVSMLGAAQTEADIDRAVEIIEAAEFEEIEAERRAEIRRDARVERWGEWAEATTP